MSTERISTCDRCEKTPLESKDHHDGGITIGAYRAPTYRDDIDLCGACYREWAALVDGFFSGVEFTVHRRERHEVSA